jgi:hypothetical protein
VAVSLAAGVPADVAADVVDAAEEGDEPEAGAADAPAADAPVAE